MSTKETGGPAFASGAILKARARQGDPGSDFIVTAREEPFNPGMFLRDYFAAKAMQSIEVCHPDMNDARECKRVASHAYMMADAMLEARTK